MRINQFVAKNLGIARRQADQLVIEKKIKVNGELAELFFQVQEDSKVEFLDDNFWRELQISQTQTILMYKETRCLTTKKDDRNRPTIYDFLPKKYQDLKPAGRLDFLSEGLLVLSNDGKLLEKLMHPRFGGKKVYLVGLRERLSKTFIQNLKEGVTLEDYKLNPVFVKPVQPFEQIYQKYSFLNLSSSLSWYEFTLSEGRNNEIRKLCEIENHKVHRLIRVKQSEFEMSPDLFLKKVLTKSSFKDKIR